MTEPIPSAPQPPGRTLVTGDTGFVGAHVLARWPQAVPLSCLGDSVDLRDSAALRSALDARQFDSVLHLAAQSFVPESIRDPHTTYAVNFIGTLNLLEALRDTGFTGRFLQVGTSDAYGLVAPDQLPVDETQPLHPRNPYAVSKVAAEALAYQWSQTAPFSVVLARPFNHIGAGQSPAFVVSDFARQLAAIAAGKAAPVLTVGNLEVTRDFSSVIDVVNAYARLLEAGQNGQAYNICSGIESSVRGILDQLIEIAGIAVDVRVDPARCRPAEQPRVRGSHHKLTQHTGWQPTVPLRTTLEHIYRYWEQKIDH